MYKNSGFSFDAPVMDLAGRLLSVPELGINSALYKILTTEIDWKDLVHDLLIVSHGLIIFSGNKNSSDRSASPSVENILQALEHRSVDFPSDEPLLIGNLTHLDGEKILQSPPDLRMPTMWSLLWSVPRGNAAEYSLSQRTKAIKSYR